MQVLDINGAVAVVGERGDLKTLWRRFSGFIALRHAQRRARQRQRAVERELATYPDALLADIGLCRADLPLRYGWLPDAFVAYGPTGIHGSSWGGPQPPRERSRRS